MLATHAISTDHGNSPPPRAHTTSRPTDNYDADPHHWTINADTYDGAALEQIRGDVPEGHVLLHVRVDRD